MSADADPPSPDVIARDVFDRFIDQKVVINVFRAGHVEAILLRALGGDYKLTLGWESWDLQHIPSGLRIEVKQSAAKQTWGAPPRKSSATFDIAPRRESFDGNAVVKLDPPRRLAHIYIFAWHGDASEECDHRDARQWRFLAVPTSSLPANQKTITRTSLLSRYGAKAWIRWSEIATVVNTIRSVSGDVPVSDELRADEDTR